MRNMKDWLSVMEEKMARFGDVVNTLKGAISNVEKKKEISGRNFRKKCSEKGCKKS